MFRSSQGSVFTLGALGDRPRFIGCTDMDTLTEPGGAIDTLVRCFNPDGGWNILDYTVSAPDPVTTTFSMPIGSNNPDLLFGTQPFGLLITQRQGGRIDLDANYDRAWVICSARAALSAGNVLQREGNEASELTAEITGMPPVVRVAEWQKSTKSTAVTAIDFIGEYGVLLAGSLLVTQNAGATWTEATPPFTATHAGIIQSERNTYRLFLVREATTGSPLAIAYSDDWGTTWVTVNVGSTSGQGANGVHFLSPSALWIAASNGNLYRSVNGGIDWADAHGGLYTTGDLNAVVAYNELECYVAGDADVLLFTRDGGTTWALLATGSGDDLTAVAVVGGSVVVGTATGALYAGTEDGVFWRVTGLSGAIMGIGFLGRCAYTIVAATATALLISVNGGYSWRSLETGSYTFLQIVSGAIWAGGAALSVLGGETLAIGEVSSGFSFDFSAERNSFYLAV